MHSNPRAERLAASETSRIQAPSELVSTFDQGVSLWCSDVIAALHSWRPSDDSALTAFIVHNTRSHTGRRAIDVMEGRDRLIRFLRDERDLVACGERPRLKHNGDRLATAVPSIAFDELFGDQLWSRLGDILYRRADSRRVAAPVVLQPNVGVTTRPWSETGNRTGVSSARLDPTSAIRLICGHLAEGGTAVLLSAHSATLGRPVWGVDQQTLRRTESPARGSLQRTRVFAVSRSLRVALELGDVSIGSGSPMFRLRKVARRGLVDVGVGTDALYQESRRALAHVLYMLEQMLYADCQPGLAARFGDLLDRSTQRPERSER